MRETNSSGGPLTKDNPPPRRTYLEDINPPRQSEAPVPDRGQIERGVELFRQIHDGEGLLALRAFKVPGKNGSRPKTLSRVYESGSEAEAVEDLFELSARGTYGEGCATTCLNMNPVRQDGAPDVSRVAPSVGSSVKRGDIGRRRLVVVDVDFKRPDGDANASDPEKARSREVARQVEKYLTGLGFPKPWLIDSGNGWHLYYAVDLEPGDAIVGEFLKALAARFKADPEPDGTWVEIDTKLGDAPRVLKAPGTVARKAEHTEERPQRVCEIVGGPEEVERVPRPLLERVVDEQPKAAKPAKPAPAKPKAKPEASGSTSTTSRTVTRRGHRWESVWAAIRGNMDALGWLAGEVGLKVLGERDGYILVEHQGCAHKEPRQGAWIGFEKTPFVKCKHETRCGYDVPLGDLLAESWGLPVAKVPGEIVKRLGLNVEREEFEAPATGRGASPEAEERCKVVRDAVAEFRESKVGTWAGDECIDALLWLRRHAAEHFETLRQEMKAAGITFKFLDERLAEREPLFFAREAQAKLSGADPRSPEIGDMRIIQDGDTISRGAFYSSRGWSYVPIAYLSKAKPGKLGQHLISAGFHSPWKVVNRPFEDEYPEEGEQLWNRAGARHIEPEAGDCSTWTRYLGELGQSVDDVVAADPRLAEAGIRSGGDYLTAWLSLMFCKPLEKIPALALIGDRGSGKSTFHERVADLFLTPHAVTSGERALVKDFNGELSGAVLVYVEEVNVRSEGRSSNVQERLKKLVTGQTLSVERKGLDAVEESNSTHWVFLANKASHVPVEDGDVRVTMIRTNKPSHPDHQLADKLRAEAPAFMHHLLTFQYPPKLGRLWLPVLGTEIKAAEEEAQRSSLRRFLDRERVWLAWKPEEVFRRFREDVTSRGVENWNERRLRQELNAITEASDVGRLRRLALAIRRRVERHGSWEGSSTTLLAAVGSQSASSAEQIGRDLNEDQLVASLRDVGVEISEPDRRRRRKITRMGVATG